MVVSKDGTENFNTIVGAILTDLDHDVKPFFKKGTYHEYIIRVDKNKSNIFMIGEGKKTMIITGNRSFLDDDQTYDTTVVGKYVSLSVYIYTR